MRDVVTNVEHGIALIDLGAFGGNGLDQGFYVALETAFLDLMLQDRLEGVILDATRGMPRSATMAPRPTMAEAKRVSTILGRIESFPKPVVAVVDGICINEGMEFALSAHYRICSQKAQFAFNQISLGSIPCFGGTQRLPRLTGARVALDMLLNARGMSATHALDAGLVDHVVEGDVMAQVRALMAEKVIPNGPRPTRSLVSGKDDPRRYQQQMAEAKTAVSAFGLPAADALVECIEAAQLLPVETGLSLERSLYEKCEASDEATALRYVMRCERGRLRQATPPVKSAVIAGAGAVDAALCVALLDAGLSVFVLPQLEVQVELLNARIETIYGRAVQRGKLSQTEATMRMSRLARASGSKGLATGAVVFDTGVIDVERLAELISNRNHLILSARTGRTLSDLSAVLPLHSKVVGIHLDKAAHIANCAELISLPDADASALDDACAFVSQIGKIPVSVGGDKGAATPVIRKALFNAAEVLLLNGAQPRLIDDTLVAFGFRKGPLAFRDEIGLEAGFTKENQPATNTLLALGRSGRTEGLGYYRYAKGDPTPRPDGTILWALSGLRDRLGIEAYEFSADDVLTLCLGAMMNAGAKLVEQGMVAQPSDIDILAVHNLDFPSRKGGPMRACETLGLFSVKMRMVEHEHRAPQLWALSPMVENLIKNGSGFSDAIPIKSSAERNSDDNNHQADHRQSQRPQV